MARKNNRKGTAKNKTNTAKDISNSWHSQLMRSLLSKSSESISKNWTSSKNLLG